MHSRVASRALGAIAVAFLLSPATAFHIPIAPRRCNPQLNLLAELPENKPPPEAIVAAVEKIGGARFTAADLAAQGGVGSIDEAVSGLSDLASALAGAEGLSVSASSKGDLLYAFPFDVRKELSERSNAAKVRDAWNSAKPVLETVGRVSFGLALFASIAIIFTAITVLTSSTSDERDDRRDNRGPGGMMGGGMFGGGPFGFGYGFSPLDLFFPRPYGFYYYGWFDPPPKMSLPEAIFSFCFGDGDPNKALRAVRVRALAETIRANGNAVVAESLAPYLDPPSTPQNALQAVNVDESWVLPAVQELGGKPEVRGDGTIVYVFDDLSVSALASEADLILADPQIAELLEDGDGGGQELLDLAAERGIPLSSSKPTTVRDALQRWASAQVAPQTSSQSYLEERTIPFSNAEGYQLGIAAVLGLVNLGGAAYLGNLLSQIPPGVRLPDELGVIQTLFPALLVYAVGYVAVPLIRFVNLQATNAQIEQRNENRKAWAAALRNPAEAIKKRLDAAKSSKKSLRVVTEEEVTFDSAKELSEQPDGEGGVGMLNPDLDDFDRRLREAEGK